MSLISNDEIRIADESFSSGMKAFRSHNYARSLEFFALALNLYDKHELPEKIGRTLYYKGLALQSLRRFIDSIETLEQATSVLQRVENPAFLIRAYKKLGIMYSHQRNYNVALIYFSEAISLRNDREPASKFWIDIFESAGQNAQKTRNYLQAIQYYRQTVIMCEKLHKTFISAKNYQRIGNLYENLEDLTNYIKYTQKATQKFLKMGKWKEYILLKIQIGYKLNDLKQFEETRQEMTQLLSSAENYLSIPQKGVIYRIMGYSYSIENSYELAIRNLLKALEYDKKSENKWALGDDCRLIGKCLYLESNHKDALTWFQKSLEFFFQTGAKKQISILYLELGRSYKRLSLFDEAIENIQAGLAICEATENLKGSLNLKLELGHIKFTQGKMEEFYNIYHDAKPLIDKFKYKLGEGLYHHRMGMYHYFFGRYREGIYHNILSLEINIPRADFDRISYATNLSQLAEGYLNIGRIELACQLFHESLELNTAINYRTGIAWQNFHLGKLYSQQEEYQKALPFLKKSIELSEQIDSLQVLFYPVLELGKLFSLIGADLDVLHYYQQALDIAFSLNADNDFAVEKGLVNQYIGEFFLKKQDFENARVYFYQAILEYTQFMHSLEQGKNMVNFAKNLTYITQFLNKIEDQINQETLFTETSLILDRSASHRQNALILNFPHIQSTREINPQISPERLLSEVLGVRHMVDNLTTQIQGEHQYNQRNFNEIQTKIDAYTKQVDQTNIQTQQFQTETRELLKNNLDLTSENNYLLHHYSSQIHTFFELFQTKKQEIESILDTDEKIQLLSHELNQFSQQFLPLIKNKVELQQTIPINQWERLESESQDKLVMGVLLFEIIQKSSFTDFSPAILQLCIALENEIYIKIFRKFTFLIYHTYVKKGKLRAFVQSDLKEKSTKKFANTLIYNLETRKFKPDKVTYPMGTMLFVLRQLHNIKILQNSPLLTLFQSFLDSEISSFPLDLINKMTYIKNNYRNDCAHEAKVLFSSGDKCFECIMPVFDRFLLLFELETE